MDDTSLTKEGVFDLNEERMESGSGSEHCSDVKSLIFTQTHASYAREVDSRWPVLPFPFEGFAADTERRRNEDNHSLSCCSSPPVPNAQGTVIKTLNCTPLDMFWMMIPKVQVHVWVHLFTHT